MNDYIYSWFICRTPQLFDLSKSSTTIHELVSQIHRTQRCKTNIDEFLYHVLFGDFFNDTQLMFDKEIPVETFISNYKGVPNVTEEIFKKYNYISKAREEIIELISQNKQLSCKNIIKLLIDKKYALLDIVAILFEISYIYLFTPTPNFENIDILVISEFDTKIMTYMLKHNLVLDIEYILEDITLKNNSILKQLTKLNEKKLELVNDNYYITNRVIQDIKRRSELQDGEIKTIFKIIGLSSTISNKKVEWKIQRANFEVLIDYLTEDISQNSEEDSKENKEKLTYGGCYLLQKDGDYVRKNNRFKIGKAKNLIQRLNAEVYRDAHIFCTRYVENINDCEREIIVTFTKLFKLIDICDEKGCHGKEYFEGDVNDMIIVFNMICSKYSG